MSLRRRIGAAVAVAGLAALASGLSAAASYAATPTDCSGVFQGSPPGSLTMTTDPVGGSVVAGGDPIGVHATWSTADWASINKVDTCVSINGSAVDALGDLESPAVNDGVYDYLFHVPADQPGGTQVCLRVGVHGQPTGSNVSTQKSNIACFTVEVPPTTTTTSTTTSMPPTTTTTVPPSTTTTTTTTQPSETTTTTTEDPQGSTPTTTASTTTTTAPASTTTTAPPTITTIPAPLATTTTGPATDVLGETTQKVPADPSPATPGGELPRTGSNSASLLVTAGVTLLLGGLAVAFGENDEEPKSQGS